MVNVKKIPFDDQYTWDLLSSGNTKGIFQLETHTGQTWSAKVQPQNLEELSALISILRPGSLRARDEEGVSMSTHYAQRKNHLEETKSIFPYLDSILEPTYQCMVYQEQAMQIAVKVAGFNEQEADELRCLSPNTVVQTKIGEKSLDEIMIGDYVHSPYGFTLVTNKFDNGFKDLYEITLKNKYKIQCTLEHKFLCNDEMVRPLYSIILNELSIFTDIGNSKVHDIQYVGYLRTIDIEVKHHKHVFYGNNIATSNSAIGKKKADKMAKVKEKFIAKAKTYGVASEEEAKQIFAWIEKSQKYSFNHCLSPETLVETKNGFKTLDDVKIGEFIDSPFGWVEVLNKYENGEQDTYRVVMESGKTIECTLEHQFLCEDGEIRPLWEIATNNFRIQCHDE